MKKSPEQFSSQSEHFGIPEPNRRYLEEILRFENLQYVDTFSTGHSGCIVVKVLRNHEELVLKVPTGQNSQKEILANIEGYTHLANEGLIEMLPEITHVGTLGSRTYLITTYLGADFAARARVEGENNLLFQMLADRMLDVYERSKKHDNQSLASLQRLQFLLTKNFNEYIIPSGIIKAGAVESFLEIDLKKYASPLSTFGVFDFTPEDIYLTGETIKYPDPKSDVRGNPIVDLACFAGVSRDISRLPGANFGYQLLHDVSVTKVADLLELTSEQAEGIFNLGRALQFSLSSRFRVEKDQSLAVTYAINSLEYLQKV